MDKNALRNFAIWAREYLIKSVSDRASLLGVYEDKPTKNIQAETNNGFIVNGITFNYPTQMRNDFIRKVTQNGYKETIEEIAYTWFNRIVALRFMEVNGYLTNGKNGEKIYVIGSTIAGKTEPDALTNANKLSFVDKYKVYDYQDANDNNGLYRYILTSLCNSLNNLMPMMFEKIGAYTELLLPNNLLDREGFIEHLVNDIVEDDWKDQVQVLGWLYEYYVSTNREKLRKLNVVNKSNMATVNQVFTPDWIVDYLADNSVGRIWLESYPNSNLKSKMKYYIDYKDGKDFEKQFSTIKYKNVKPQDIRVMEPCCGSGHILVYAFDLLFMMYQESGYLKSEIPSLILKNNLWGLDIDKRAAQLAYFSLMMKARSEDCDYFNRDYVQQPNVYELIDTSNLSDNKQLQISLNKNLSLKMVDIANYLIEQFKYGKVIGSSLVLEKYDYKSFDNALKNIDIKQYTFDDLLFINNDIEILLQLSNLAQILTQKYDVVITNPPYSTIAKLDEEPKSYILKNYKTSKAKGNFCSIYLDNKLVKENGFTSMITSSLWLIQDSFNLLRDKLLSKNCIITLADIGEGEVNAMVETVATVTRNSDADIEGSYFSLKDKDNRKDVNKDILTMKPEYISRKHFLNIPSCIISLKISQEASAHLNQNKLADFVIGRDGLHTGGNENYVRLWHEVENKKTNFNAIDNNDALVSGKKWFPYCKGGQYRRYYGNNDCVIDWENDGCSVKSNVDEVTGKLKSHGFNGKYAFLEGATWTYRSHSGFALRYTPNGFMFDGKGSKIFANKNVSIKKIVGFMNSCVAGYFMKLSTTTAYEVSSVTRVPFKEIILDNENVEKLSNDCIEICKNDWDMEETSWEFEKNPLI